MPITVLTKNILSQTNIEPNIVVEIEGAPNLYSTRKIFKKIRYGDPIVYGQAGMKYGGFREIGNQKNLIDLSTTSTTIKFVLDSFKGRSTSIGSMQIGLVDIDEEISKLISPGVVVPELINSKVKVWLGFGVSDFRNDYTVIFRGRVEATKPNQSGVIVLNLTTTDTKKLQTVGTRIDTKLTSAITDSQTNIELDNTEGFLKTSSLPLDPLLKDASFKTFIRIEDEYIEYDTIIGTTLTDCTRAQLGSVALAVDAGTDIETFYKLEGNNIDLALKIMLSDLAQTPYVVDLPVTAINVISPTLSVPNSLFFQGQDLGRDHNIQIGDLVRTKDFNNVENNFSDYGLIVNVIQLEFGSYIITDQSLVDETTTVGTCDFLSKYNTLGDFSVGMTPDEVDIEKHEFYRDAFFINSEYRFLIKEEVKIKDFFEKEIYRPLACYSLSREARSSLGYHIAPLPNESIQVLNSTNIVNPDKIVQSRSLSKNFLNEVYFKYEDSLPNIESSDKFTRGALTKAGTSAIPNAGRKTLVIESKGLRDDLGAKTLTNLAGSRILNRYKNAAESIDNILLSFDVGFQVEIGDTVILNSTGLQLVNFVSGDRDKPEKLYEVVKKTTNLIDSTVNISLIDTAFNVDAKFGLYSPSSLIDKVIAPNQILIKSFFGSNNDIEFTKWDKLKNIGIKVRDKNFTTIDQAVIIDVSSNLLTFDRDLSFTPNANDIIEYCDYDFVDISEEQKLIYAYYANPASDDFPDGKKPYTYL